MIVYFDTVKRKRPVREGGELVKLDWALKKVLRKIPLYPTEPDIVEDPNPRGNSRGGKGILLSGDEILVGSYHTILVFDLYLKLRRTITNNLFVNIHEMCFSGENIWISSTAIDAAVLVDQSGRMIRSWWPREQPLLQEKYGLSPMKIDKTIDNRIMHIHKELSEKQGHTHLNSVTDSCGNVYALLNKLGIVVQIEPETKVILEDPMIRGSHSPVVIENGNLMILCSSFNKDILIFDLKKGELIEKIHLLDFDEVKSLHERYPDQPFNKSIFVRGLEVIDSQSILVGVSPASILEIEIKSKKLLDFYQHSFDVGDAVHGLVHTRQ